MENNELRNQWEIRIASYRSSGQTQARWCEANQVSFHQFKYWLKKIEDPSSQSVRTASFSSILIEDTSLQEEYLHVKIGEACIEVKPGFNPEFLSKVVRVLKMSC